MKTTQERIVVQEAKMNKHKAKYEKAKEGLFVLLRKKQEEDTRRIAMIGANK